METIFFYLAISELEVLFIDETEEKLWKIARINDSRVINVTSVIRSVRKLVWIQFHLNIYRVFCCFRYRRLNVSNELVRNNRFGALTSLEVTAPPETEKGRRRISKLILRESNEKVNTREITRTCLIRYQWFWLTYIRVNFWTGELLLTEWKIIILEKRNLNMVFILDKKK